MSLDAFGAVPTQIRAMDVKAISRNLSAILRDMGIKYDHQRLAHALKGHELDLTTRAAQVAVALGSFGARIAKVSSAGQRCDRTAWAQPAIASVLMRPD